MTLKEVVERTTHFFKEKKFDSPRLESELLISYGLQVPRIQIYLKFDQPLKEEELDYLRTLVRRRSSGEPLAYITGEKAFFKQTFFVDKNVLIPRPETEQIVEEVLKWSQKKEGPLHILDLGTGSGCLGLSLLKEIKDAHLCAVDISESAIGVAKKNASRLEVQDRVDFIVEDALNSQKVIEQAKSVFERGFDIIISNPPYISSSDPEVEQGVREFEPALALFSENEGLHHAKSWLKQYSPFCKKQALVMFEMGYTQGVQLKASFEELNIFDSVEIHKDIFEKDRFIKGVIHG